MTGRGKGGKGLGKGGAKRHRKVLRDNIQGITKPAIRRLARRGGVKRISGLIYEETIMGSPTVIWVFLMIENEFDRSRQPALGQSSFNEHQTRFGPSPSLQTFQAQQAVLSSPPPPIQFPQPIFQQQPYVPQFNNLLPSQNLPVQNNNGFHFSQPSNINSPINNFQQVPQLNQNIPQPIPTLAT
ncbi:jg25485, partial [Pararge aegeria aegeria]